MKHFITLLVAIFFVWSGLYAQQIEAISANSAPYTPVNLVEEVFLGEGVEVLDITYDGPSSSVGYFFNGQNDIGIDRGIVVSTGVIEAIGPDAGILAAGSEESSSTTNSTATDVDVNSLADTSMMDFAKYTIRFVPSSDSLTFNYVFASEEYPEFACTEYSDIFGFFISGPGISGPFENNGVNIALIPGTNSPVTVNNIHPQNGPGCPPVFEEFYNDNDGSSNFPIYDGYLDVFTAGINVIPCEEYVIKIVIADQGDPQRDSGVFLEANSFSSNGLEVTVNTESLDGTIYENCEDATIIFRFDEPVDSDYTFDISWLGEAVNGVDFEPLPTSLTIPAGQDMVSITIEPIEDGIAEASEDIILDVAINSCVRDTFYLTLQDFQLPVPELDADTTVCAGASIQLNGAVELPPIEEDFFTATDTGVPIVSSLPNMPPTPAVSALEVVGVRPTRLDVSAIKSVCLDIEHNQVQDLKIILASPSGNLMPLTTNNGGMGANYTNTCFTPESTTPISSITAADAPFTGDFSPEGDWSELTLGTSLTNGIWRLYVLDNAFGFNGIIRDWSITFENDYSVTYNWSPAGSLSCSDCPNPVATPSTTTVYDMTLTDIYGCETTDAIEVQVINEVGAPQLSCTDVTTNSIGFTWTAIEGVSEYEVNINGSGWIMPNIDSLNHEVTGLELGETVEVEVRPISDCGGEIGSVSCTTLNCTDITTNIETQENLSCPEANDGFVMVSASGDNPPFTFTLMETSAANTDGQFDNLSSGNYSIVVEDALGCTTNIEFTINEPTPLTTMTIGQDAGCNNNDGRAELTISGGTMPYTIQWSNTETTTIIDELPADTYYVTVTDDNNCQIIDSVIIDSPIPVMVSVTTTPTCFGLSEGTATIVPEEGVEPFSYTWDVNTGLQTTQTAEMLAAGTYMVTITDANNCTIEEMIEVTETAEIISNTTATNTDCDGPPTGTATVNPQGGAGGFSFLWDDPNAQTTATASNLGAGTYTVTITDSNNCTATNTATVTSPSGFNVDDVTIQDVSCFEESDGSIRVITSNATGDLTFTTSDSSNTTGVFENLAAGTYTVTVSDSDGCEFVASGTVNQPDLIQTQAVPISNAACMGNEGMATVAIAGGTPPYSFEWSNTQTDSIATGLSAGVHTVTVTDANGCEVEQMVDIGSEDGITLQTGAFSPTCAGDDSATPYIYVVASGGSGTYSYMWDATVGMQTQDTVFNIAPGTYSVEVQDDAGCIATAEVTISETTAIQTNIETTPTDCGDTPNGTAIVSVMDGTPQYTYLWSDEANQTTATATNLGIGTYYVTVTDAAGCTAVDSAMVNAPVPLTVDTLLIDPVQCFNGQDGGVTIQVSGSMPFSYQWDDPNLMAPIETGLAAGTYQLTVTDAANCTITQEVTIPQPPELTAILTPQPESCLGAEDGQITTTVNGGTMPYEYLWSNDSTTTDLMNVTAGNYQLILTDANACVVTVDTSVAAGSVIDVQFQAKDISCFGMNDGNIEATPQGGVAPYVLNWAHGPNTEQINNLAPDWYTLSVTDSEGCMTIDSILLVQPPPVNTRFEQQDISCLGSSDGSITINAMGGVPPFEYRLGSSAFSTNNVFQNLSANVYDVEVRDDIGCVYDTTITLAQPLPIEVTLTPEYRIQWGEKIPLNPSYFGEDIITYTWSTVDTTTITCVDCPFPDVSPFVTTTYSIQIENENGCIAEALTKIIVDRTDNVYIPNAFSPNGDGINDEFTIYADSNVRQVNWLRIFDRWGNFVFERNNFPPNDNSLGWNGIFKGKPMNPAVFVYVAEVEFVDGSTKMYKGDVTLVK